VTEVQRLRAAIEAHQAGDEREAASRDTFLAELGSLERPFDEHADLTHVTGSGIVVGPRGVVLHNHRRLKMWMQPGGHIEPGETPADAALRESEEETGLRLSHPPAGPVMVHVDVHPAANGHIHLDVRYLLFGPDHDPAPPPDESQEVAWFSWHQAVEMADDSLLGALRAAHRVIDTSVPIPGTNETSERSRDG
jgi:8-oxo-dGTP pyrophosphatase MutT (NUDIX family)